jgi:hypothetical protein
MLQGEDSFVSEVDEDLFGEEGDPREETEEEDDRSD